MQPQVSTLLDSVPAVGYILAGVAVAIIVFSRLSQNSKGTHLDAIPTVGSSTSLKSWWNGPKFQTDSREIIQEGYEKYKTKPFKVADRYRWIIIVSSREHLEELRKAPEDALSFHEASNDTVKTKYTMGQELVQNIVHIDLVRSRLTRNLASLYDEIRDEVCVTFDKVLNLRDHEWKSVPAFTITREVVCRTSNRLFVGLPLCRHRDWIDLNLRFTLDVAYGAYIIKCFPDFLGPLVAYFMTNAPGSIKRGMKLLGPIIEERLRLLEEHGKDWPDKPNDFLSWLLDAAPDGPERTVRVLTLRILAINFAAIHTASNSFSQALFFLADSPQYIQPLREEVELIVEKEGWSKASLAKMHKIDSFMKEAQRMVWNGSVSVLRKVVKDFTFSDGTLIPKGTSIAAPSRSMHLDDEYYPDAHVFNPFRFSDMRDEDDGSTKHQFVSTSFEYLPFGYGKHACTGRFFAADELKTMLAHLVVSYDVKLTDDNTRPKALAVGPRITADPSAQVMFRNRVD